MDNIAWKLFKKTGNIKYFLLSKKLEGVDGAVKKNSRNSNR